MSEPIPLLPVGPILTIAILLLAAIAKAGEWDSSPAGAAPLPPGTKDLPQ